jgi:hypothetical protein
MANKVLLKKSSVAAKVPVVADLDYGELALNYTDEKLYFKNASNAIKSFTAPNDGQLTLAVSGVGLSGSATFTANQSTNSTFTVTSNATSANTASAIVARDASGNFSAGTITATLSGSATSIANNNIVDYLRITNTGGVQRLLMGNQDSAGVNNPSMIVAANGSIELGNGNSWTTNGGTFTGYATFNSTSSTLANKLIVNTTAVASNPALRINTTTSASFVHIQENIASNLTSGQHAINVIGRTTNTKNSGYVGYYWAGDASGSNFVTLGHWGNDDILRVYADTYTQSLGSMRAPIFYDSDDTGYYSDPNGLSRFSRILQNQARVDASRYPFGHYAPGDEVFSIDPTWSNDQLQAYFSSANVQWVNDSTAPAGYAIQITGNVNVGGFNTSGFPYIPVETDDTFYMEVYIKDVSGTNTHYMGSQDYNHNFSSLGGNPGSYGYWVMGNSGPGANWTKYSGYISGFGTSVGQFASGTKYWIPQALFNYTGGGTSYISGWKVYKLTKGIVGRFPNSTTNIGEAWYGRANDRNRGTFTIQLGGNSSSGRQFEVVDYAWSTVLFNANSAGVVTASNDFRAPVFYDSNNTDFYVDPNSTTNSLNIAGSLRAANYNNAAIKTVASGTSSTGGSIAIQQETSEGWTGIFCDFEPYTGWGFWHDNPNNYFSFTSENSTGSIRSFSVPSRSSGLRTAHEKFRIDQGTGDTITGRDGYANSSFRAPIFYDSNDTAYYVDPASTSRLNQINYTNIYLASDTSYGFIGSSVFTDTINSGYAGDQLEFNYVRGTWAGISHDSLRAPIFYDYNDTAYYTDPASTSQLNYSVVRNLISVEGYRFTNPQGATYFTTSSTVTGAIKIQLPADRRYANSMLQFKVKVYEYTTGYTHEFIISGYNYSYWVNVAATQITDAGRSALTVRWGDDGTYNCVWIGETNTSWSYPQVFITDVQIGYSGVSNNWGAGWGVTFVTSFNTVDTSRTASMVKTVNNASNWGYADYATIFYDSNNTGYYLDPTSTTSLRTVGDWRSDSSTWTGEFSGKIQYHASNWYFQAADQFIWRNSGGTNVIYGDQSGNHWATGSSRSPIFYDSADTSYYWNPNTSAAHRFQTPSGYIDIGPMNTSHCHFQTDRSNFYFGTELQVNGSVKIYADTTNRFQQGTLVLRSTGPTVYFRDTDHNSAMVHVNSNVFYVLRGGTDTESWSAVGSGWWPMELNLTNNNATFGGDVTAAYSFYGQTYYERENTAYYIDAAGTSVLYGLTLSGNTYFRPQNWIQLDGSYGIYWPNHYGAHFYPNTASTYTQFRFDGSKNSYGGFYDSYSAVNAAMYDGGGNGGVYREANGRWYTYYHVGNDCLGIGSSSTNSAYGVYCGKGGYFGSRVDGTIFYDANDTAYYTDPNSYSYVYSLRAASYLASSGNIYTDSNYGYGHVGLYASTRYQGVFAMGDSYKLPADGTTTGNLYGIAWSYPSAGGAAANLASHGMLILENGVFKGAWGGGRIVTPDDVRATLFYDYNDTAWYVDPASTSLTNDFRANIFYDRYDTNYYAQPRSVSYFNDFRPNIIYDRQDTAYYVDPNSTTYLNVALANRFYTGYDSGVTNSFSCSNWFRSSGATGWYNASYGGGIYMEDGTWVRVHNSKAFYVANEIAATGNVTAYYSDSRLKTNLGTIKGALQSILKLSGFRYVNNDLAKSFGYTNEKVQLGVSAQEVEALFPEVVSLAPFDMHTDAETGEITSKSGENYKTVAYDKLVPVLIEAIKEQDDKIARLEALVEKLLENKP